jgi:hypothetical protein
MPHNKSVNARQEEYDRLDQYNRRLRREHAVETAVTCTVVGIIVIVIAWYNLRELHGCSATTDTRPAAPTYVISGNVALPIKQVERRFECADGRTVWR